MASRISYLGFLQKLHLISSILVLGLILFYLLTGFVMARHDWFAEGVVTEERQKFALSLELDTLNPVRSLEAIKKKYQLSGRTQKPKKLKDGRWLTQIERPGVWHELSIDLVQDSVEILTRRQESFGRIVNRLHHIRGFEGGNLYFMWGIMVDLSIFGFLVFAISGLLIWLKLRKGFKWGWWFLIPSSILTFLMLLWILFL